MMWYLSYNGQQIGPLDMQQARARASADSRGHAWREGFAEWRPIDEIDELASPMPESAVPPPLPRR